MVGNRLGLSKARIYAVSFIFPILFNPFNPVSLEKSECK
uniref:Uncharacterized protein n=1 Tax=Nymphaea colorata TaxID=210225 RepID=A0A5K0WYA4_9MAGN